MIDSATISFEYIKKDDFLGSYKGMRYRLGKINKKVTSDKEGTIEEINQSFIEGVIWPDPYNYFKTPEDMKQFQLFPFSKKGKEEAIIWLNEKYTEQKDFWNNCKVL